jgi:hypothetical protein
MMHRIRSGVAWHDGGMAELPDRVRRRLAEVFGDTMPEVTRDELDDPRPADRERDEEWYRANRPPHHDRDR